jgi:hypothetical protein
LKNINIEKEGANLCVIIAKKCKLKSNKKENWFLYKIRDRNYNPKYQLEVENKKGTETLFLTDHINKWSEGINDKGLMIVSAALDNHSDFEDNGQMSDIRSVHKKNQDAMLSLRSAMGSKSVEDAKTILIKDKFVGTSFISDGDKLVILEIYVNDGAYEREAKKIGNNVLNKMNKAEQIIEVMKGITDSDYDVAFHEVKKDKIAVRTNHGRLLDKAGYQPEDEDLKGYTSSMFRWKITKEALEKLGDDAHPFDILTTIKNLKGIQKKSQNNPIRIKEPVDSEGKQPYYSTTIVMLTPTGTLFAVPLEDEVNNKSKLKLKDGRKVDFVLLPKNLPLFESFRGMLLKERYLR